MIGDPAIFSRRHPANAGKKVFSSGRAGLQTTQIRPPSSAASFTQRRRFFEELRRGRRVTIEPARVLGL